MKYKIFTVEYMLINVANICMNILLEENWLFSIKFKVASKWGMDNCYGPTLQIRFLVFFSFLIYFMNTMLLCSIWWQNVYYPCYKCIILHTRTLEVVQVDHLSRKKAMLINANIIHWKGDLFRSIYLMHRLLIYLLSYLLMFPFFHKIMCLACHYKYTGSYHTKTWL